MQKSVSLKLIIKNQFVCPTSYFINFQKLLISAHPHSDYNFRHEETLINEPSQTSFKELSEDQTNFFGNILLRESNQDELSTQTGKRTIKVRELYFLHSTLFVQQGNKIYTLQKNEGFLMLYTNNAQLCKMAAEKNLIELQAS